MSEMLKRIEKILLTEKAVIAKDGTFVPVKDILYLTSKRGDVLANLAGKKPITLPGNLLDRPRARFRKPVYFFRLLKLIERIPCFFSCMFINGNWRCSPSRMN